METLKKSGLLEGSLFPDMPLMFVCRSCRRARMENGEWLKVKRNSKNRDVETLSSGLCLDCAASYFSDTYADDDLKKMRVVPYAECLN